MLFLDILIINFIIYTPTFISNAIPVVIKNFSPFSNYNKPINEKLLWKNKTYRWFISWIIFWIFTSVLLYYFFQNFENNITKKYFEIFTSLNIAILWWFLQSFWALFWDCVKSYIKRKLWKKPWSPWPFFDWIDYIIWSLIFFSFIYLPDNILIILLLILISPLLSLISNIIAYFIWWKKVWY